MPRTKIQSKAETIRDPCKQFRQILKSKQYDEEHRKLFNNNDLAEWCNVTPAAMVPKMQGNRDFSMQDIRLILENLSKIGLEFTNEEKVRVLS